MWREACASNSVLLEILLQWQILEVVGGGAKEWIRRTLRKKPTDLLLDSYLLAKLPLGSRDLADYLEDGCRHAIAHFRRYPNKASLHLDSIEEEMRLGASARVLEELARHLSSMSSACESHVGSLGGVVEDSRGMSLMPTFRVATTRWCVIVRVPDDSISAECETWERDGLDCARMVEYRRRTRPNDSVQIVLATGTRAELDDLTQRMWKRFGPLVNTTALAHLKARILEQRNLPTSVPPDFNRGWRKRL